MTSRKDLSLLSNWLEEKLKEHFMKKSQVLTTNWNIFSRGEPNFTSLFVPNQDNGVVPIQTLVSDFRILDFKLEKNADKTRMGNGQQHSNGNVPENHYHDQNHEDANALDKMFQPSAPVSSSASQRKSRKADEPYKTYNSHVYLVYQDTSQSVGKELRLNIEATQIDDMQAMESIFPKYELSLDEHQIDVYTRVFPVLKCWTSYNRVSVSLHVPECFYGSYEADFQTRETASSENADNDEFNEDTITDHMFKDDIMSKVAAGLEFYEREKRNMDGKVGKQARYRLFILEDVSRLGFKLRNVRDSSTFLSLLNVEEALESLAEIHSVSWAYAQVSGRSLLKTWPFLNNPLYLPYIKDRVIPGFAAMERLVQAYLICSGKETQEEGQRILKSLAKLSPHLKDILEGARHPRRLKCLVHQSTCFSNFLFKYSLLNMKQSRRKPKGEYEQLIKQKGNNDKDDHRVDDITVKNKNDNNNNSNEARNPSATAGAPLKDNQDGGDGDVISKARREGLTKELSREVMIINWRTASVGSPMIDVAFLLLTALPPKTRRAETEALLRIYWNSFRMHAKKFGQSLRWSDKELYEDYLGALLYTCVLITGNISGSQCELDDEGMEVFIEAIKDLRKEGII